jgi:hypothetical protein
VQVLRNTRGVPLWFVLLEICSLAGWRLQKGVPRNAVAKRSGGQTEKDLVLCRWRAVVVRERRAIYGLVTGGGSYALVIVGAVGAPGVAFGGGDSCIEPFSGVGALDFVGAPDGGADGLSGWLLWSFAGFL